MRRRADRRRLGAVPRRLLPRRAGLHRLRRARRVPVPLGARAAHARCSRDRHHGPLPRDPRARLGLRVPRAHPRMAVKGPIPEIPAPIWRNFKDLQEWEQLHKTRPVDDKHSALFESVTEGIHSFPGGFVVTTAADAFLNWARKSSVWPVTFGLACCAIEMMATFCSRFDVERLGMVPWASPRHSDLMIVSGTVTIKMAPMLLRIYDQMPDPKWAVSMASCANSGGPFRHGYHVVKGVDRVIPVDVYVPGCPPPPQSPPNRLLLLQEQISSFKTTGRKAPANVKVD